MLSAMLLLVGASASDVPVYLEPARALDEFVLVVRAGKYTMEKHAHLLGNYQVLRRGVWEPIAVRVCGTGLERVVIGPGEHAAGPANMSPEEMAAGTYRFSVVLESADGSFVRTSRTFRIESPPREAMVALEDDILRGSSHQCAPSLDVALTFLTRATDEDLVHLAGHSAFTGALAGQLMTLALWRSARLNAWVTRALEDPRADIALVAAHAFASRSASVPDKALVLLARAVEGDDAAAARSLSQAAMHDRWRDREWPRAVERIAVERIVSTNDPAVASQLAWAVRLRAGDAERDRSRAALMALRDRLSADDPARARLVEAAKVLSCPDHERCGAAPQRVDMPAVADCSPSSEARAAAKLLGGRSLPLVDGGGETTWPFKVLRRRPPGDKGR